MLLWGKAWVFIFGSVLKSCLNVRFVTLNNVTFCRRICSHAWQRNWEYRFQRPYRTELKQIKKITATEPQPHWTVFKLQYLRTLHIVWSLIRRRVTRRLTRLQTMYNVFKYCKTLWNNDKISIYQNRNMGYDEINRKLNLIGFCIYKGYFTCDKRRKLFKVFYLFTHEFKQMFQYFSSKGEVTKLQQNFKKIFRLESSKWKPLSVLFLQYCIFIT